MEDREAILGSQREITRLSSECPCMLRELHSVYTVSMHVTGVTYHVHYMETMNDRGSSLFVCPHTFRELCVGTRRYSSFYNKIFKPKVGR